MILSIPASHVDHLRAMAVAGYPFEICGLLIGRQCPSRVQIERVVQGRNLNTERMRERYLLDPEDMLRADREAEKLGCEIVGVWHTHPDHPAVPSETDRSGAWEGWSYLIVSATEQGVEAIRSWRLAGESFIEESIEICQP